MVFCCLLLRVSCAAEPNIHRIFAQETNFHIRRCMELSAFSGFGSAGFFLRLLSGDIFFVEGGTEVGWGLCLFCLVETVWNASLLVVAFPTKAWLKRKSSNSVLNVDARSLDCITHTQPVGKLHVRGAASRKAHI